MNPSFLLFNATLQLASVSKVTILLAKYPMRCVDWSTTNALKCGPTVVMVTSNAHVAVSVALEVNAAGKRPKNLIK